jgi:protein KRI1
MEKKLKKLREIAEDEDVPFDLDDLKKDFDPEEHDRKMKHFKEEEEEEETEEKPTTSKGLLKFRYRQVEPNDFGLSTDEILNSEDKQLNAWVSMKKVTAYRGRDEDLADKHVYERKAQNTEKKKKLFESVWVLYSLKMS